MEFYQEILLVEVLNGAGTITDIVFFLDYNVFLIHKQYETDVGHLPRMSNLGDA